ncbi:MAG: LysR family transcriptional regulator [Alphaproteobacteria bacterium]|nr:LysR family transcriptional regulator [Alphaproteobacteria bacterium]
MHTTLKQLSSFEAVARLRNFTRAAEELNLSQPAVSMQVKQLENQVQSPLLEQRGRTLELTEIGLLVLDHARAVLDEIDALSAAVDSMKGMKRGKLRLSTVTTVTYFMPTLLRTFCQRHPEVDVIVNVANRQDQLQQIQDNETDIAIMGRPPDDMALTAIPFLKNPLVIVAPREHPLAKKKNIPVERLTGEPFLMREVGSGTRGAMERFFREKGVTITTSIEVSGAEALKQGVQAGLGLALLSRDSVELELTLGRLVELDVKGLPIQRDWYLVHRSKKRLNTPAAAFKVFIEEDAAGLLNRAR